MHTTTSKSGDTHPGKYQTIAQVFTGADSISYKTAFLTTSLSPEIAGTLIAVATVKVFRKRVLVAIGNVDNAIRNTTVAIRGRNKELPQALKPGAPTIADPKGEPPLDDKPGNRIEGTVTYGGTALRGRKYVPVATRVEKLTEADKQKGVRERKKTT